MIRSIIIDDEERAVSGLKNIIKSTTPEIEIVACAYGVLEGVKRIQELKPELVFLDIEMSDGLGLDVTRCFDRGAFKTVFVTAHSHYAVEAFKQKAYSYLLKPIDPDDLLQLVDDLKKETENALKGDVSSQKMAIPTLNGSRIIELKAIVRLQSDNNYTRVFLEDGKQLMVSKTLRKFEEMLPAGQFMRVHQSHMVNFNMVEEFHKNGSYLSLKNGDEVPLNSTSKAFMRKALSYGLLDL